MRAAVLSPVSPSFILDKDECIDLSHRLVSEEVWTPTQGRYFREIMARVCVEKRIVQPAGGSDDLPLELARAAGVHRQYYFRFCKIMGPVKGERLMAHHLFLRRPISPGGAYPVDEHGTVSGGSSLLVLFESSSDLDRRARIVGVDRDPDRGTVRGTPVLCGGLESCAQDSSPVRGTPSIFIEASQTERDRHDPSSDPDLGLGSISESSSSCSSHLEDDAHAGVNSQASADARTAARATSRDPASPGIARTPLRGGVSTQQSTAISRGANAPREGQKSRGSSALAPAPGASDSDSREANAVLRCWAMLFERSLDHAFSAAWTALILTQLRKGLRPWELIAILSVTAASKWHRAFPQREELDVLFGREDWMAKNLSRAKTGPVARLCAQYGVEPPPRPAGAPTGRIGADDQGAGDGLDSTEQVTHTSMEEFTRGLNKLAVSSGVPDVPRPGGRKGSKSP